MPNRLASENSPYLIQHAHNPVDWYPWGEEALEKARIEDKPIFLSIGYAACHWCHVMAHESFEDAGTASIMNEHFVNIKVDREERPDLDSIYMQAVVAVSGQGGWPMSVFLTPQGKPFYGGTYFPPARRYNMPAFQEILLTITRLWQEDRPRLLASSDQISTHLLQNTVASQVGEPINEAKLNQSILNLAQTYDWNDGGWGKAPKFPQPMVIEYLLRASTRGNRQAAGLARHALQSMSTGGMYDVIGGGFARYSTDDRWCIPHFEKMLYDNAQLALVYLHGWLVSGENHFRRVCESTLDFLLREMSHPLGGFYSSLDADSEGEEGKFYAWTPEEIQNVLPDPQELAFFTAAYNVTPAGNFEGQNVLQRALSDEQLAGQSNLQVEAVPERLKTMHARLLEARSRRVRPATDDKILVSWNALALAAFAEAGRYLKREDYLAAAERNARFLLDNLLQDGRLKRSWRAEQAGTGGRASHNAYLEDYAALILGLLALYQSDANAAWYSAALDLDRVMLSRFVDPEGGFFDTSDDHETLLLRPKDLQDNATPSGNALAAGALLLLAAYEGQGDWRDLAENMLSGMQEALAHYPTAFGQWLCAADFALGPVYEAAILGNPGDAGIRSLVEALWASYRPRLVAAVSAYPPEPGAPALLHERKMLNGQPAAYVCQGFVCNQPTASAGELALMLAGDA